MKYLLSAFVLMVLLGSGCSNGEQNSVSYLEEKKMCQDYADEFIAERNETGLSAIKEEIVYDSAKDTCIVAYSENDTALQRKGYYI